MSQDEQAGDVLGRPTVKLPRWRQLACDPPIPMSQNSIAIVGRNLGRPPFPGTFGRYTCPPVNNNGGGAVGGPN
jgi:hypothetical protein